MRTVPLPFIAPVRGVTHYPDTVSAVRAHDPVTVERDTDNPYDPYACCVKVNGHIVGYLPRELSRRLSDRPEAAWRGSVHEVLVGDIGIGLRVQVTAGTAGDEDSLPHDRPRAEDHDSGSADGVVAGAEEGREDNAPLVHSTSGRLLGTWDGQDEHGVWVHTPAGQRVSYPPALVVVQTASPALVPQS